MTVPSEMTCAVKTGPFRVETEQRPVPTPKAGEALVQICEVGICGGDLHQFKSELTAQMPAAGVIPGHEGVGLVVDVGPQVEGIEVGERVVLGGMRPDRVCGVCEWCRSGLWSLCPSFNKLSASAHFHDGDCAEYVACPVTAVTPMPETLTWDEGANAYGLAACMYALEKPRHRIGETVAIFGPGCAGLYFGQLEANCLGASKVIMVGRSANRLKLAERLGFETINSREESPLERIDEITSGDGVDIVIDTTGVPEVMDTTVKVAKKRGSILVYAPADAPINFRFVLKKELSILGSSGAVANARSLRVIEKGLVKVEEMITHHFPLQQTQDAYELAISDDKSSAGYVKGAIVCSPDLIKAS